MYAPNSPARRWAATIAALAILAATPATAEVVRTEIVSHLGEVSVNLSGFTAPSPSEHEPRKECVIEFDGGYRLVVTERMAQTSYWESGEPRHLLLIPINGPYLEPVPVTPTRGDRDRYTAWYVGRHRTLFGNPVDTGFGSTDPDIRHVRMFNASGEVVVNVYYVRQLDAWQRVMRLHMGSIRHDQHQTLLRALEDTLHKPLFPRWWVLTGGFERWYEGRNFLLDHDGEFRVAWWVDPHRREIPSDSDVEFVERRRARVVDWHRMDMEAYAEAKGRIALCTERHLSG